jgi:hypothetical protein
MEEIIDSKELIKELKKEEKEQARKKILFWLFLILIFSFSGYLIFWAGFF